MVDSRQSYLITVNSRSLLFWSTIYVCFFEQIWIRL